MNVWFVSSGEYSDYGVDAFFASEELAQKYIDAKNYPHKETYEEYRIEGPEEVIDTLEEPVPYLTLRGRVFKTDIQLENSTETLVFPSLGNVEDCKTITFTSFYDLNRNAYGRSYSESNVFFQIEGIDIDRVNKVYTEKTTQALAEFDVIMEAERQRRK